MQIPFSPPNITEEDIQEVIDVLKSGWITTGPKTVEFEQMLSSYIGTNHVICLSSATAGLEMILRMLGIGKGDEVITSAYTYTASASVICHVGATPILIDVEKGSYHLTTALLERAINKRTKAIIGVDIAGLMCDYDDIFKIVEEKKHLFSATSPLQEALGRIAVIADAAHSLGATYHKHNSGQVADFTSFSFHAVKNLTTGEGGAITWRSTLPYDQQKLYKECYLYALHGQTKDARQKNMSGNWEYDVLLPGYKCNMMDIQAALGLSQLKRYPSILDKRKQLMHVYSKTLGTANITPLTHEPLNQTSSYHLYMVHLSGKTEKERNQIISLLAKDGINTNVHYKPLPLLTAYRNLGFMIKDYPHAYEMYSSEITLPLYPTLTEEECETIAKKLCSYL